jgi:hypothetical protein
MRIVAAVTCLSLTGCSFIFTKGPPEQHRQMPYFECSTGRAAPIADSVFAGLQVIGIGITAGQSEAEYNEKNEVDEGQRNPIVKRNTAIGLNVVFGAMWALSAYYGYTRTAACRAAKNEWIMRGGMNPQQPYGQQPYGPQPYGPQPSGPSQWPPPAQPAPAPAPAPVPDPAPEPAPAPEAPQ